MKIIRHAQHRRCVAAHTQCHFVERVIPCLEQPPLTRRSKVPPLHRSWMIDVLAFAMKKRVTFLPAPSSPHKLHPLFDGLGLP